MHGSLTHADAIEAYAWPLSVESGEVVGLHVSTSAPTYDVEVVRWGAEREVVWTALGLPGRSQSTPDDADAWGCGWDATVEVSVDGWRSGCYVATLTASQAEPGHEVGHAFFVVRSAGPRAPILYVVATNTWSAYNEWGGASLYTGGHQVSFHRPFARGIVSRPDPIGPDAARDDRKARPRRTGEEPDVDGSHFQAHRSAHRYPSAIGSTGWWSFDRRFVEWAERDGFSMDFAVSGDLAVRPGLTEGYRCVVGAGHDEYWSAGQRDAVEGFVADGGTYVSFSGNTMFWQVRLVDDHGAAGSDHLVCHKYRAHLDDPVTADDPGATTGMWADPVVGRPESRFLGAGSMFGLYHRFGQATPRGVGGFVVYRDDHWLLAGTGLRYGDVLGADDGVVGYETVGTPIGFDEERLPVVAPDPSLPEATLPDPGDVEVVAVTPASNLGVGEYPASIAALSDQGDLEFVAERIFGGGALGRAKARHGTAVLQVCRPYGADAGEVVVVGSTDWVFGLDDPAVARVTRNALERGLERPGVRPAG